MTADLLEILVTPEKLPPLAPPLQGQLVRQARHAALLGYLEARIAPSLISGKLADHLLSARIHADYYDKQIIWETHCVERALSKLQGPVVLLKGAAYRALDLGLAQGRLASDVDLLLHKDQLPAAEALLKSAGWEPMKADDYDQHYYREWMHELPPLRHQDRGTIVDLHHNILPPTARFKPDANKLLATAVPITESTLYTLAPVDTVLHRCAHLFVDGDMHNSLRELVDIYCLLTLYQEDETFGKQLLPRARELDLNRPLSYALYFCNRLLRWQMPSGWAAGSTSMVGPAQVLTRFLMEQQLRPGEPGYSTSLQRFSAWILFVRSHWLRMPPHLLARHLLTQTWRRGGLKAGGPE